MDLFSFGGLPLDLCTGSPSFLAVSIGQLSHILLSWIVYLGNMKLEEQLLLLPPCYEMGPKEFHGTVRIKPTRFDERLNVRYKRKRGSKDVSRGGGGY